MADEENGLNPKNPYAESLQKDPDDFVNMALYKSYEELYGAERQKAARDFAAPREIQMAEPTKTTLGELMGEYYGLPDVPFHEAILSEKPSRLPGTGKAWSGLLQGLEALFGRR